MYEGDWVEDLQHGHGIESWTDNGTMRYEGDFLTGKKTGKGKFEFEGSFYEGDFVDGQFHGQGKYYFADSGKIYKGEFRDNNIEGTGCMLFPDGSRYDGDFENGKMEGRGIMQDPSGSYYVGQFADDGKHGTGVWFDFAKQQKRQGEWLHGKRTVWIAPPIPAFISKYGDQDNKNGDPIQARHAQSEKVIKKKGKSNNIEKLLSAKLMRQVAS